MHGTFEGIQNGLHGLKVHEFGDMEDGCESTGDVWNPYGSPHGKAEWDINKRRLGDLQDVQGRIVDYSAEYKVRDTLIDLSGPDSIVGRAIVLYEREDDFDHIERPATPWRDEIVRKGMGERIACCVVGLVEPEQEEEPEKVPLKSKPVYRASPYRRYAKPYAAKPVPEAPEYVSYRVSQPAW